MGIDLFCFKTLQKKLCEGFRVRRIRVNSDYPNYLIQFSAMVLKKLWEAIFLKYQNKLQIRCNHYQWSFIKIFYFISVHVHHACIRSSTMILALNEIKYVLI